MLPLSNLALNTECPLGHSVLDYMDALGLTLAMASNSGLKPYATHGFSGAAVSNACSGFTFAIIYISAAQISRDNNLALSTNLYFAVTPNMTGTISILAQKYRSGGSGVPDYPTYEIYHCGNIATTSSITILQGSNAGLYGHIVAYK